ncbi:hypothetical protein ACX0G7_16565 [Flavitalea antarctica]
MNQIVQQSMLSPRNFCKAVLISFLIATIVMGCSKSEGSISPGKPVTIERNFQFNITPANQFDEETSKNISLKLRLSITRLNLAENSSQTLWDTIVTNNNLYEFTHRPGQNISTTIKAAPEVFTTLVYNYVIIYNHRGALVTRSESAGLGRNDPDGLVVKL